MAQRAADQRQKRVRHNRATIIDVAASAGVSRQTVSRVLAGGELVADRTHAEVTRAIEELGYRPNHFARNLVRQTSCIIGVAARDLNSPLTPPFIARLQTLCRPLGYHVIVANFDLDDRGGIGTLDTFVSLNIDGIALFPSAMDRSAIEDFAASYDGRIVAIGRTDAIAGVHSLSLDEEMAAKLVVGHLRATGRHRIAILAYDSFPGLVHQRTAALESTLREMHAPSVHTVGVQETTVAGGRYGLARLMDSMHLGEVDAIVAFNDSMAIGAMIECAERGISVPGDLAIVGYDDLVYGAATTPALTTIPQDADCYAELVFKVLVGDDDPEAPPTPQVTLVAPTLVVRGSA